MITILLFITQLLNLTNTNVNASYNVYCKDSTSQVCWTEKDIIKE